MKKGSELAENEKQREKIKTKSEKWKQEKREIKQMNNALKKGIKSDREWKAKTTRNKEKRENKATRKSEKEKRIGL